MAVDTINEDYRLVGENRLVRYASFLMKYFFPLHDDLCFEEGRLMKQYAYGTDEEKEEAYSSEVSRGEALEDRFSGKGLAQMVNTAKCVRTHRHCNALEK